MAVSPWSTPDAKRVTRISSTREERAAVISQGLTGLDAAAVAQTDPRISRLHLWQVKTGRREAVHASERDRRAVNIAMVEPTLKLFSARTGVATRRTGLLVSKEHPWAVAVVDGLTADGGQVEVTTTISVAAADWGTEDNPGVPAHILTRVAHDLLVTGRSHAYAVCLVMDTRQLHIRRIDRSEVAELIAYGLELGREFWHAYVLADVAPPLTALDKETVAEGTAPAQLPAPRTAPGVAELRARRERLDDEIAELTRQRKEIDAALLAEIGETEGVIDAHTGELVATRRRDGDFDVKAFRADHPDLAAQFAVPTTTLDWRSLLAQHPDMAAYKNRKLAVKPSEKGRRSSADRSLRAQFRIVA